MTAEIRPRWTLGAGPGSPGSRGGAAQEVVVGPEHVGPVSPEHVGADGSVRQN